MSDKSFVLDTSAIIALIEDEDGAERVETLINQESVTISCLSLMEVYYIAHRELSKFEAERRYAFLKQLNVTIYWSLSESLLLASARLKATTSISIVDAMIAATAQQQQAILVHKDPEFIKLQGLVQLESLPFKKK